MDPLKYITVLDDALEAQLLESLLREQDIPHVIKSYHDTAYDGLFQSQQGWGHIEAPEYYESHILRLLADLRSGDGGAAK